MLTKVIRKGVDTANLLVQLLVRYLLPRYGDYVRQNVCLYFVLS